MRYLVSPQPSWPAVAAAPYSSSLNRHALREAAAAVASSTLFRPHSPNTYRKKHISICCADRSNLLLNSKCYLQRSCCYSFCCTTCSLLLDHLPVTALQMHMRSTSGLRGCLPVTNSRCQRQHITVRAACAGQTASILEAAELLA